MITRTHATLTMIALIVAGIVVAAGASFGLLRLGQPESKVGHFPAVGPADTVAPVPPTAVGGTTTTAPPRTPASRADHDTDD